MLESYLAIPPLLGVLGLLVALGIYIVVTRFPEGDTNVKKIGDQIHLGAMTFMKTEYTYLSIFALVVIVLVWFSLGEDTAIAVLAGALSSSIAGWIGMYSATKANVRTATAASESGAESVSNYEYERREQDKKRQIKLLDPRYLPMFLEEFERLIRR